MAWVATLALSLQCLALAQTTPSIGPDVEQWPSLNTQVMEAYKTNDYAKGTALAEQALELARKNFGTRDPQTLTSLNNLAGLYTNGCYRLVLHNKDRLFLLRPIACAAAAELPILITSIELQIV
jgi:hypothetical protein